MFRSIFLAVSFLALSTTAFADTDLAGNYTCVADAVFKGNKELTDKAANRQATNQVNSAIHKYENAVDAGANKKQLKKLAAQVKQAKSLRKLIAKCAKGDFVGVDPLWSRLSGKYPNGSYNDTVNNVTGPITANMTLAGDIFSGIITVGGSLYGEVFEKPVKFKGNVNGVQFPFTFETPDSVIGAVSFVVSADGKLEIIANDVPNTAVKQVYFTANLDGSNNINGTYDISGIFGLKFGGGTFSMLR